MSLLLTTCCYIVLCYIVTFQSDVDSLIIISGILIERERKRESVCYRGSILGLILVGDLPCRGVAQSTHHVLGI